MANIPAAIYHGPATLRRIGGRTGVPPRFAEGGADVATIRSQLKGAPKVERRRLLVEFVRHQAMKTLGVTESIDTTQPLRELGLDFADVGNAREQIGSGTGHQNIDRQANSGAKYRTNSSTISSQI